VYRVELGAGLADISLRQNRRDSAAVVTFTTGAPIPTRWLEGRAVDWMQQAFAANAAIEAMLLPDTLVYRSVTDSSGRFRFGPLPDGEFVVTAAIDQNRNGRRDGREAWDTARAAIGVTALGEIWMFPRDTVPPRIEPNGIARADSFAIVLTLSQPLDPSLGLGSDAVTVMRLADSSLIPVASGYPQATHDSIYFPIDSARQAETARAAAVRDSIAADSARAVRDTAAVDTIAVDTLAANRRDTLPPVVQPRQQPPPPAVVRPGLEPSEDSAEVEDLPTQKRPRIGNRLVLRLNGALEAGQRYLVEVRGVRALSGMVADTLRGQFETPEAPKPVESAEP
jgi:hypothetical protein